MTALDLFPVERIQVADIRPGDTIVVTLPDEVDPRTFKTVGDALKGRFGDNEVVVVTAGVDISVMHPEGG